MLKDSICNQTGGDELPIHLLLKNPIMTKMMVTTLVEAWPESMKEMTTVFNDYCLADQYQYGVGELPNSSLAEEFQRDDRDDGGNTSGGMA